MQLKRPARLRQCAALLHNWLGSLFARIALLLILGLLAAQGVSLWLQSGERASAVAAARGEGMATRMAEIVRVLEATAPANRPGLLPALNSPAMRVSLIAPEALIGKPPRGQIAKLLAERLGSPRELHSVGNGMPQHEQTRREFELRLADGQWLRLVAELDAATPALSGELLLRLAAISLIVLLVVLLAVRQLGRPLQQLASAADSLGRDLAAAPLAEQGTREMRHAAAAFNRMQARIRSLVDERARALAAVSHDLRTPLTRLRLRAELVEDDALREQISSDLDAMTTMIDSTLDYLRNLQESEAPRRIDMNALLQSIAEDSAVLGRQVAIDAQLTLAYSGRLGALRRALQNLVDNACKYGSQVRIRAEDSSTLLRLIVEDAGPGVPEEALAKLAEPYYRPDVARRSDTGGVGLGLSIARDIALLHGGRLLLANRPGGGFAATLELPR
ncbi:ATP-binding protein [Uliginosibacterium sediminicola]|uniref:histidine kinase n=1 Tax=Uliginosibacterium sediminicola TaxID=2024550 RepID=A0ABU9Z0Y7_9RHOO